MTRWLHPITRRDFVRATAAGMAAIPLSDLGGLDRVLAPKRSRVAVVRTTDRRRGVTRALALLGVSGIRGRRVVLKPNFNSADPAPASTHDDTLAQLVTELQAHDPRSITLGESSGPHRTRSVMEQKGIFDLAHDMRFDVVDYDRIADDAWVHFAPEGTHWSKGFWLPRLAADAEYMVTTCCLKTHGAGGVFTMSLKLAVGLTPKRHRVAMHLSRDMRRMIAELNTGYRPQLIVLDGVEAFTDGGPSHGTLRNGNVMIAGDDRVAVDAVGLAMLKSLGANDAVMQRPIFAQEQIARAVELGLGAASAEAIDLVTDDAESATLAGELRTILARG